ncbi:MAG: serine hydrolase, partial [Planctomycetes bacterium]|nr:serine hydrolase [Planctomycetota bacterium]
MPPRRPRRPASALLLATTALLAGCATAPAPAPSLAAQLQGLVAPLRDTAGIYVRHLGTGEEVAIAADELFPTASMIKLPILGALLAKVEAGELDYHQELVYTKDRLYPGEDLLGSFADGSKVALDKVAMLMITTSDNSAALWCQELAGTGASVNAWLASQGFAATRVNSRTPGREAEQARWGWGQTTPREMATLLVRARQGRLGSPAASEEALRCLSRIYWDGEALSALPPWVHAASK